jgi:hypothetical protein
LPSHHPSDRTEAGPSNPPDWTHGDYLREHITHGYAITVHSAQGATADTTYAVLGENTNRALLYVVAVADLGLHPDGDLGQHVIR